MNTARVVQERTFLPHRPFVESAAHFCAEFERKGHVSWHDLMAATTLLALSVEALANTVGEHLVPHFKDFESSSPKAKIRVIYQQIGVDFKRDRQPLSDVLQLLRVRNNLAHPKFRALKYESQEMPLDEARAHYLNAADPLHEIEKDMSPEKCKKWLISVRSLVQLLEDQLDSSVRFERNTKRLEIYEPDA